MLAYASIWPRMSFAHASPIMYPPLDCSADSAMTSHRPKCSAGTTPRISYRENARLLPQFFALAERAVMPVYCLSFSCSQSSYTLCCGNYITSLFSRGGHSYMCCLSSFIQYDFSRPGMCSCVIDRAAEIAVSMIFSCGAYMMSIADKQQTAI